MATIGYEGLSIEAYFNRLIRNNIRCLVDVRKNPRSMKFGFTRSRLESLCTETGIKYISIPELGIETDDRKNLSDENSYKLLFESYLKKTVKNTSSEQLRVVDLISKYKRIALTCFEADINKCHRKVLADYIQTKYKPVESIIHL